MAEKPGKLKSYPKSEQGNFEVIDTIGVPHPYCITPKHVAVASDDFCGMLGKETIIEAEKRGATCGICRKNAKHGGKILSFEEHEQALLVSCKAELKNDKGETNPELHKYLLSIKERATKDGFAGFAFKKSEFFS
jgi:hypothetical protein